MEKTKVTAGTGNIALFALDTKDEDTADAANLAVECITRHSGGQGKIEQL
jgi:hypothetical protein